jgi:predicted ATPase
VLTDELIGRQEAKAALDRVVVAAAGGTGRVWHIAGEAGAGKTSLIEAARARLDQVGVGVLAAMADDGDQRRSLSVIRALLPGGGDLGTAPPWRS